MEEIPFRNIEPRRVFRRLSYLSPTTMAGAS